MSVNYDKTRASKYEETTSWGRKGKRSLQFDELRVSQGTNNVLSFSETTAYVRCSTLRKTECSVIICSIGIKWRPNLDSTRSFSHRYIKHRPEFLIQIPERKPTLRTRMLNKRTRTGIFCNQTCSQINQNRTTTLKNGPGQVSSSITTVISLF